MENNKNPVEIRNKIINFLRIRGPSLPVHISKETGLSTLFSGAFLSELASEKTIKISNMKVGGSPLYYLPGHESQLENFYKYLSGKEKEAFLLLKEKKILEDKKLEPAIRVALRNIKDFAFPFFNKTEEEQNLFWRFHSFTEQEVKELFEKELAVKEVKKETPEIKVEVEKTKLVEKPKIKLEIKEKKEVEKPLITIKEIGKKQEKVREKSDFVHQVINFLISENIEISEEKELKKKEYVTIIRINSDIGKISFLLIAKDKKSITENDLTLALQKAQALKMPAFLISSGSLNKKAQAYLEGYSSLIKFRRI